jgi:glutamine amidotransferase
MCRWAAYLGQPIFLSEIVTAPAHSLIQQSRAAAQCKTAINADGFGLAWYDRRAEPGLYRDVYPAWSDPNLAGIAHQVQSGNFMAHVRASTGSATSRNNCHPFVHGRWSFMHNGQVGGFERFRKSADMLIDDALYASRRGATDSEALFLIACGLGLDDDPRWALEQAMARLMAMSIAAGETDALIRCTAALSDGQRLHAVRYASDAHAPSLYYRWNAAWQGWAVVSEPYCEDADHWVTVPPGSFCTFDGDRVEIACFDPLAPPPALASASARQAGLPRA